MISQSKSLTSKGKSLKLRDGELQRFFSLMEVLLDFVFNMRIKSRLF